MSEDLSKLSSKVDKTKWYSIITAIIVLIQTIVDIVLR